MVTSPPRSISVIGSATGRVLCCGPRTNADLTAIVRFGRDHAIPVVARGSGNSVGGQALIRGRISVNMRSWPQRGLLNVLLARHANLRDTLVEMPGLAASARRWFREQGSPVAPKS
jgi:hypothetical protein